MLLHCSKAESHTASWSTILEIKSLVLIRYISIPLYMASALSVCVHLKQCSPYQTPLLVCWSCINTHHLVWNYSFKTMVWLTVLPASGPGITGLSVCPACTPLATFKLLHSFNFKWKDFTYKATICTVTIICTVRIDQFTWQMTFNNKIQLLGVVN